MRTGQEWRDACGLSKVRWQKDRGKNILLRDSGAIMLAPVNAVALITGASRGIGRGIALELAGIGCDVVINFRSNNSAAQQTADACLTAARSKARTIRA